MARVIVVGIGRHRDFGFQSLRTAGHAIGAVDIWEMIPVEWCDWYAGTAMTSAEQVAGVIAAERRAWDAIVCWDELAVQLAHGVGRLLGIPAACLEPELFRDKALMHRRLQRDGIPSAFIGAANTLAECRDLVRQAGLPAVVKPADYGGSDGVRLVITDDDVAEAYVPAAQRAPSGRVVVDRFIPGPEVSIECVSSLDGIHHVLCITEKLVSDPPFFVELGHLVPARLPCTTRDAIEAVVGRALTSLGMRRGVSHTEVKLGPDGPVVIESAARQAGDMIPKLVSLATGSNPHLLELAAIQGADVTSAPVVAERTACVRFFGSAAGDPVAYPPIRDTLGGLEHLIVEVGYWYPENARPPRHRGNGSRFGYCLLSGPTDDVHEAHGRLSALLASA
jgi:biotin carboxylase